MTNAAPIRRHTGALNRAAYSATTCWLLAATLESTAREVRAAQDAIGVPRLAPLDLARVRRFWWMMSPATSRVIV